MALGQALKALSNPFHAALENLLGDIGHRGDKAPSRRDLSNAASHQSDPNDTYFTDS
jgi:hypothetical protein